MTNASTASPTARFFGAALMAVGGLIAVLSGLCSAGFLIVIGISALDQHAVTPGSVIGGLLSLLLFDAVPIGFGVGLFLWGRYLRGGSR